MVNKVNVQKLIDHLKTIDNAEFYMHSWISMNKYAAEEFLKSGELCGTAACVAGHATHLLEPELWNQYVRFEAMVTVNKKKLWDLDAPRYEDHPERVAKRVLGLTFDQTQDLFYYTSNKVWGHVLGEDRVLNNDRPTTADAIKVLEYVRDNW